LGTAHSINLLGHPRFFSEFLHTLSEGLQWDYQYAMIYPRGSLPAIWHGEFRKPMRLSEAWQGYSDVFFRLDPLFALCARGSQTGVVSLRSVEPRTRHLRKFFQFLEFLGHGHSCDDMALLLPTLDDATLAVGFGRVNAQFDAAEAERLSAWQEMAEALLNAHLNALDYEVRLGLQPVPDRSARTVDPSCRNVVVDPVFWLSRHSSLAAGWGQPLAGPFGCETPTEGPISALNYRAEVQVFSPEKLTLREAEVVRHALMGRANIDISQRMNLSHQVVKNMKSAIYRKLDITTEKELFLIFIEHLTSRYP